LKVSDLTYAGFGLGCLHLKRGDRDGYGRLCAGVVERLDPKDGPHGAYMVVRLCSLGPDAVTDPARLVELARRGVAAGPQQPHYLHALGAAHYRAGQFEPAVQRLRESVNQGPSWEGRVLNWLFLAMTHHRLGQQREARQWLAKAVGWIDETTRGLPKDAVSIPGLHPHSYLAFPLLRREAEAVLKGPVDPPGPKAGEAPTKK
jgi:hypothetical protein